MTDTPKPSHPTQRQFMFVAAWHEIREMFNRPSAKDANDAINRVADLEFRISNQAITIRAMCEDAKTAQATIILLRANIDHWGSLFAEIRSAKTLKQAKAIAGGE